MTPLTILRIIRTLVNHTLGTFSHKFDRNELGQKPSKATVKHLVLLRKIFRLLEKAGIDEN